jgi:hypothetical protein
MARRRIDDEAVHFLFTAYSEAAAIADGDGIFPLHGAARYSSLELVQRIYEAHPAAIRSCVSGDEDDDSSSPWIGFPLHLAAASGDAEKVLFLHSKYPEAISLEIPEIDNILPFHSALYSLPSSPEDSGRKREAFHVIYNLHPAALRVTVGRDEKSSLQFVVQFFREGLLEEYQPRDYEVNALIWKIDFILKRWPQALYLRWVYNYLPSCEYFRRFHSDIRNFILGECQEFRILSRLMLLATSGYNCTTLRDNNYHDRRGALNLFFSKDLHGMEIDEHEEVGGGRSLRIVIVLKLLANKDVMRRIVMML